ncbi:E2F transcription factor 6 [Tritrichomonas foetus]|uniref:E2F transcription factor 6 n=1 Tax=Tritrichomonas foetus TaxID=1144522 RepID=A0A1J4KCR1_9EUKA|nr:E2F transcription factor 6 [Tritrichomonas foetus]|eukprot:OHT07245.1 E2F transcription factor 6 [Tritrichomonas foetus]
MKNKKSKGKSSLVDVAQSFIKYMEKSNGREVDMSQIERNHIGSKRRLYDVINVLSGINYLERSNRAKVRWIGRNEAEEEDEELNEDILDADELDELENVIDQKLFELTSSSDFSQYGFILKEDILNSLDELNCFYALSGPPDLTIQLQSTEESSIKISCKSEEGEINLVQI